jgi:hypothetical protein
MSPKLADSGCRSGWAGEARVLEAPASRPFVLVRTVPDTWYLMSDMLIIFLLEGEWMMCWRGSWTSWWLILPCKPILQSHGTTPVVWMISSLMMSCLVLPHARNKLIVLDCASLTTWIALPIMLLKDWYSRQPAMHWHRRQHGLAVDCQWQAVSQWTAQQEWWDPFLGVARCPTQFCLDLE